MKQSYHYTLPLARKGRGGVDQFGTTLADCEFPSW